MTGSPLRPGLPDAGPMPLPALGQRGEGWVAIQTALAIVVLVVAPVTGAAWAGTLESVTLVAGLVLMVAGAFLFGWGATSLGRSFSIWLRPTRTGRLVRDGPYRMVRHPICTAQAAVGFGWALVWASPIALALALAYALYLQEGNLRREESWLVERYPTYDAYRRQVRHRMLPLR